MIATIRLEIITGKERDKIEKENKLKNRN